MNLETAGNERLTDYHHRLAGHDWSHEFSDDARVYRAGRCAHRDLLEARAELDPDSAIWNHFAPELYRQPAGAQVGA